MQPDPFGNLREWGPVLEQVCQMADEGNLSQCQPGLIRILRYRDNWRLREEVLNRIGTIDSPDSELVLQVLNIIADEKLYYEVRILACETMLEMLKNPANVFNSELQTAIRQTVDELLKTPHPPIFEPALKKVHSVSLERFSRHNTAGPWLR